MKSTVEIFGYLDFEPLTRTLYVPIVENCRAQTRRLEYHTIINTKKEKQKKME